MRIGILTHQLWTNYGGILQNFALQELLKGIGHEPVTIDYYTVTPTKVKIISVLLRILKRIKGIKLPLRGWPTAMESAIISHNTRTFVAQHINTTNKMRLEDIQKSKSYNFDAIIVGSDQVWRGSGRKVEKFFLSDFPESSLKKIAYAASFGIDEWDYTKWQTSTCRKLAMQFDAVSVREKSGIALCREHLGINPTLVLDPTLMIDRKIYESLICSHGCSKRAMTYILDATEEKQKIVDRVCMQKGLSPHKVMADHYFGQAGSSRLNDCVFPPIEEWLEGFINCEFVVTDSFHGTVFAIIFNKPFVAIVNNKRGKSRFDSILGLFHLEDRLINNELELERAISCSINWADVNKILSQERDRSLNFLKNALK